VEYVSKDRSTVYAVEGAGKDPGKLPVRLMDCMDCHNRPSHAFELPERAVDQAMLAGDISPALPFAKKKSVEILRQGYSSSEEAERRIPAALESFYRENYKDLYAGRRAEVQHAGQGLLRIYNRNVFPEMNISWGTYPNNIGHTDFPGCFRCHDEQHTSAAGRSISQDCNSCHNLLAMEEPQPQILNDLGVTESQPAGQK
jgi:hypothetical protein